MRSTLNSAKPLTKKEARLAAILLEVEKNPVRYCPKCERDRPTIDRGETCAFCRLVL